jgi:glycosyltransferase involved in cell wall biosynthesis
MKVVITHPDARGGVSNYYRQLQGRFTVPVHHFIVGRTLGEHGRLQRTMRRLADYWKFRSLLEENDVDLVHLNPSLDSKSFIREGLFALLARVRKKKVIVFFHGWKKPFEVRIERYFLWVFNWFYGKADALIVLSNENKETLERWGVLKPIYKEVTVINDNELAGFDIHDALKKRLSSKTRRILFLARIIKEKGIYEALESFSLIHNKHPMTELVIAGEGAELDNVKSFVRERGFHNVTFAGYIRDEEKRRRFREAHIFFLPSYAEGCPVSVIEAMAYGLPVVTRSVGGVVDFFENGTNGFISQSLSPCILANHIETLLEDKKLYKTISLHNYQYAQSHFLASRAALRLEKIYETTFFSSRSYKKEKPVRQTITINS